MTARIFALCNQKGGVGKSTAVRAGRRVLAVDNDPQGNLTTIAAAEDVGEDQAGLADALSSRAPETIRDVIVPGVWPEPAEKAACARPWPASSTTTT